MDKEKVKRANLLLKQIEKLKDQKDRWESSENICELRLDTKNEGAKYVEYEYINFEDLKLFTISRISKRLEELQREFDDL